MKFVGVQIFLLIPLILAGCSSSANDVASQDQGIAPSAYEDSSANAPEESAPDTATRIPPMKSWIPKYIQTGLASGIMVEFTGVKKDKPLHARYAGIELRRYP